jgi:NAD(P)-dependent dehydrogenase (short-subunit alcohol dehydrogenase family)
MNVNQKVALVTGATQGIGFEVARQLGLKGIKVIIGARSEKKASDALVLLENDNIEAEYLLLDIVDEVSIQHAYEMISSTYGKLNILVNNAGISTQEDQSPSTIDNRVLKGIFNTNFFSQISVTQKLLPLLQKESDSRIVNVSSSMGSLSLQSNPNYKYFPFNMFGYNVSKTALNAFTIALAKELNGSSIKINSADPDWCRTNLGGDQAPYSPEDGARVIVHLATLGNDGPTGSFFNFSNVLGW